MCSLRWFRRTVRRIRRRISSCSCTKKEERTVYVEGFLFRHEATEVVDPENMITIPLKATVIHDPGVLSIACIDMGEVVMGLGYVFEILRYPPTTDRPTWTLSFTVWNESANTRLLFRKCFTDVAAFFYVIDATEIKWMGLAKSELKQFFNSSSKFPRYYLVIFLNKALMREAMRIDELEDFLSLDDEKCSGYLIQPIHKKSRKGLRDAAFWLLDKLVKNADQTIDVYPDQILRDRRSVVGAPLGQVHTFALEHPNAYHPEYVRKKSEEADSKEWVPALSPSQVRPAKAKQSNKKPPTPEDIARLRNFPSVRKPELP